MTKTIERHALDLISCAKKAIVLDDNQKNELFYSYMKELGHSSIEYSSCQCNPNASNAQSKGVFGCRDWIPIR